MKSAHGVIQGYDRVAAVDAKHQVIVGAEALGEASERQHTATLRSQIRDRVY
jgi:hypothetical protein